MLADCKSHAELSVFTVWQRLRTTLGHFTLIEQIGAGGAAQEIARELRADAYLEGTVRREGERVRIAARLVNVQPVNTSGAAATSAISRTSCGCSTPQN